MIYKLHTFDGHIDFEAPSSEHALEIARAHLKHWHSGSNASDDVDNVTRIRRRETGYLTEQFTSSTSLCDMDFIVANHGFDAEESSEEDDYTGIVTFLFRPLTDASRIAALRDELPDHASLVLPPADKSCPDCLTKAEISFLLPGHTYEGEPVRVEVLISDKVPLCTEPPVRGEGECNGEGHDLWAPVSLVGGLDVNPGVFGLGGDRLLTRKVCLNCACTIETTDNGCRAHDEGKPECEIRVLPPSEFTQAWAEATRLEFRRMRPVDGFNVGELERVLDFVDAVRSGNCETDRLEELAQRLWTRLCGFLPSDTPLPSQS